jgi:DNA polymerase III alpha subunit
VNINQYGQVTISDDEAFRALYQGVFENLNGVHIDNITSIQQYNRALKQNADHLNELEELEVTEDSIEFFDEANQCEWFMPEEYKSFPIVDWLYEQCTTEQQKARVDEELPLFIQHGMFDLLFYLKYLVDTMRSNKILWGLGRGSSVASYVLYLIGIHKIDSIKYNLDIREFLK